MCQILLKSETYGETCLLIWHRMTQRLSHATTMSIADLSNTFMEKLK